MERSFCEYCMKENEYKVHKANRISILNDEEINYIAKVAICTECENEIFISEICDYNLSQLYDEYKKKSNIITSRILQHIITKYNINEQNLSVLLGWEKDSIHRYLNGDLPDKQCSETLDKIYKNPSYYSILLQTNKDKINPADYNKSRQAIKVLLEVKDVESRIDAVIKQLLIGCEEFSQLTLHRLLYYVQAFYYVFTDKFLFADDCEASFNGPIYRKVLERYEKYGFDDVNKEILDNEELIVDDLEKNIVESIIKFYGCYSGKILRKMTQYEAPWILTRTNNSDKNATEEFNCNRIIEKNLISVYFKGIKEKHNIVNLFDIEKYSTDLFKKISM